MARSYNTNVVALTGTLTRDPVLYPKDAGKDDPVWTILPLAINKRATGGRTRVIYQDVKVWNWTARACVEHLSKGSRVAAEGSLDQYDPEFGDRWYFIDARNVEFIGPKKVEANA
jgi:single-stranded DNA-binding protein